MFADDAIQIQGLISNVSPCFLEVAGLDAPDAMLFRKELGAGSPHSIPFDSTRLAPGRYLFV
ncbi:MAG: hypothetical protein IPM82_07450 [Saprospiraceae bacterium]|nr:hypothetical protein [Saprospiraceae bacterium]